MEQKVTMGIDELVNIARNGLPNKNAQPPKAELAAASKGDLVRLAEIRLRKAFQPKITELERREKAARAARTALPDKNTLNEEIRLCLREEAARVFAGLAEAITALNDCLDNVVAVGQALLGEGKYEPCGKMERRIGGLGSWSLTDPDGWITSSVDMAGVAKKISVPIPKKVRALYADHANADKKIAEAAESVTAMAKTLSVALDRSLVEVEESVLQRQVGNMADAKEITDDIGQRMEEVLKGTLALPELTA